MRAKPVSGRTLASIRQHLGLEADAFAANLGIEPSKLRDLEDSTRAVPPLVAARARWLEERQRRLDAIAAGGHDVCEWASEWERRHRQLTVQDDLTTSVTAFQEHYGDCGVCAARDEALMERFGPQEPFPLGRPWGLGSKVVSWLEWLSPSDRNATWRHPRRLLRNIIVGVAGGGALAALLLAAPAALGAVVLLYMLLSTSPFPTQDVIDAVAFGALYIGWGAAGGAAGGLVRDVADSRIGHVITGITSMSVFCFLLFWHVNGGVRQWTRSDWYVWGGLSLLFGLAAAWGFMKAEAEDPHVSA